MGKAAKKRDCPVVGRVITPAECGENRGSRFACPASCPHNPLAPDRYDRLREIEESADTVVSKWLHDPARTDPASVRIYQRCLDSGDIIGLGAFMTTRLYFERQGDGLTRAEQFERAGLPGLNNDERVVFRAKMRSRAGLLEVRRVLDSRQVELVDLLEADPKPVIVQDYGLAAQAVRFFTLPALIYSLPHYSRLTATLPVLFEVPQLEPTEVLREVVAHLGGPTEVELLRTWLGSHLPQLYRALEETARARHDAMLAASDARFGRAVYALCRPFSECRGLLESEPETDLDELNDSEANEGFAEAVVWFDSRPFVSVTGRAVLGRVLLGQTHWRLEALGAARLARLRKEFERVLGGAVKLTGERVDDLEAPSAESYDPALVPPRLLEQVDRIELVSSRVEGPPPRVTKDELSAALRAESDRTFPDEPIPALEGHTPREAAKDPRLRPQLLRLLKVRVRLTDQENLRTGGTRDINWLLRELGITELLFDPPPPRPPTREMDPDSDEGFVETERPGPEFRARKSSADRPPAPHLPAAPLSEEEAFLWLSKGAERFARSTTDLAELDANGWVLLDAVEDLAEEILVQGGHEYLKALVLITWFSLVPPGYAGPEIPPSNLRAAFFREIERMSALAKLPASPSAEQFPPIFATAPQPGIIIVIAAHMVQLAAAAPPEDRPEPEGQATVLAMLMALVSELDRALRP